MALVRFALALCITDLQGNNFDFKLYLEFYSDSPAVATRIYICDDPNPEPREAFLTAETKSNKCESNPHGELEHIYTA